MILHCPECKARHVDAGEFSTKPHHTHACQSCGLTWRPAIIPTVGVQFLPGFKGAFGSAPPVSPSRTTPDWRAHAEIILNYMPPYPRSETRPKVAVRYGNLFLRYSCGPAQGHFWDIYGEDYQTRELAERALREAPPPPSTMLGEADEPKP